MIKILNLILFLIIIVCFGILLYDFKCFITDIFDDNSSIMVTKTINYLFKIYNRKLTNTEIRNNKLFENCLLNRLIFIDNNEIKLSDLGLSICFQYTNNKFLFINIILTITMILVAIYSILK